MSTDEQTTIEEATDSPVIPESQVQAALAEGFTKRRVEVIQRVIKEWTNELIDLGGRNNLLNYRDLSRGTLDLTKAAAEGVSPLLQGKLIRLRYLFPEIEERDGAIRRARVMSKKALENFEERGIDTLYLGCGLATWENKRAGWTPSSPVLLRRALLRPLGAAADEFELTLEGEMEVNPTLLHVLKVDFNCQVDQEELLDRIDGVIDEAWELETAYQWLRDQASRVPGFKIEPRLVLANFAYAKLPMVRDLESSFDELVAHDLIAAIAGDEDARELVHQQAGGLESVPSPDFLPYEDEFLVLDADASQSFVVNSVSAGHSLVVKGPPGTGKSQTIANLIGTQLARGKKVLFVAEKRAAIEAVVKRLRQQGLGDLILDLHGGVSSRRAFADSVGKSLAAHRGARPVDHSIDQQRLQRLRSELNGYVEMLHTAREPWGLSVYEARAQLIGLPKSAENDQRFRGETLKRLDEDTARDVREKLAEYARLGGFTLASGGSVWASAEIVSQDQLAAALALVDGLRRHSLPTSQQMLERAATETGLPPAATLSEWQERLELWAQIDETLKFFEAAVFERDLNALARSLAPAAAGGFIRVKASVTSGEYKTARNELRALHKSTGKCSDGELYQRLRSAIDCRTRWLSLEGEGGPAVPAQREALEGPYRQLLAELEELGGLVKRDGLAALSPEQLATLLAQLDEDRGTLSRLPEIHRLRSEFEWLGLRDFIDLASVRQLSEEQAVAAFRHAWLRSILDELAASDWRVESFLPDKHEKAIAEYSEGDREHIETTPDRILRICAEHATLARDEFRDEAALVQRQAQLKRKHLPVRDFVREASNVLLAVKPCWVMSPLMVSQLLPPRAAFDVVIFDEASQITPADAIPSILRAKQLIVAGDERQLPPTAFFVAETPEEEEEQEEQALERGMFEGTRGFQSILNVLIALLPFRMLEWHYRSRDEHLIAFSNAYIYDRCLTTFPGIGGEPCLRLVPVDWHPGDEPNSPSAEVERVVDLILEHAKQRPDETLGVIAMGIKHSNRIDETLRERLRLHPELNDFFDETREERFFVKNLERVQGDERDAIILSIGYGKNERGQLVYRFGPLLTEGGERRLNVAITRAKRRLTLVSSFTAADMDPEKSTSEGVTLLRQYLQFVESGGTNLGDAILDKPALNAFEVDVRDTLAQRGLRLTPQYGVSGFWIDFVVHHPTAEGRLVLAIECDGATYHSSESARDRDRLRQEQLERIGWRFHRIWSSEWFHNKDKAVEKVMAAYEKALKARTRGEDDDPRAVLQPPEPSGPPDDNRSRANPIESDEWAAVRDGPKPTVYHGEPIDIYSQKQLVQLAQWIESDGMLRTEEELLADMMFQLGYRRRGSKIVAALTAAIKKARKPSK
jgi:very-short-patch-repair endonuclease